MTVLQHPIAWAADSIAHHRCCRALLLHTAVAAAAWYTVNVGALIACVAAFKELLKNSLRSWHRTVVHEQNWQRCILASATRSQYAWCAKYMLIVLHAATHAGEPCIRFCCTIKPWRELFSMQQRAATPCLCACCRHMMA